MENRKKKTINATLRLEEEDWEALDEKAKALGMSSRTQLLREIARGFIETKQVLSTQDKEVLGKF
ncbi:MULTISPECIES: ribbon-helix-helix protein, CopG family [unclassified Microcoleus]|uniref:ribbon-helix-helix protein, CopG family n=1 Tax=unclassified Microcoleus TaxID=2642155 RepID=UPI00403F37FB